MFKYDSCISKINFALACIQSTCPESIYVPETSPAVCYVILLPSTNIAGMNCLPWVVIFTLCFGFSPFILLFTHLSFKSWIFLLWDNEHRNLDKTTVHQKKRYTQTCKEGEGSKHAFCVWRCNIIRSRCQESCQWKRTLEFNSSSECLYWVKCGENIIFSWNRIHILFTFKTNFNLKITYPYTYFLFADFT